MSAGCSSSCPETLNTLQANSRSWGTVPRSSVEYPSQNSRKVTSPFPLVSKAMKSCLRRSMLFQPISEATIS